MPPAVIPLLFLTLTSLFAFSTADIPKKQIGVPTRFPPPDTLIITNNFEITVHNIFHIYQNSNPQTTHDIPHSHSHLIRWSSFLIIAVNLALAGYLIHVGWGRYWCQTWEEQTGHVSQGCPVHRLPGVRNGAVSAGTPTSAGDSALPPAVHNARDAPSGVFPSRGRRRPAATASDDGTSQHNVPLSQANAQLPSIEEPKDEFHNNVDGVTGQTAPGSSSSSRTLSAPVQAPPPLLDYSSPVPHSITGLAARHARRPIFSGPARANHSPPRPTHKRSRHKIFEPRKRRSSRIPSLLTTLLTGSIDIYARPTSNVFEPRPRRSAKAAPLLATLNGLSLFSPTKWFIFLVAVPTPTVPDPTFDLNFLRKVFQSSKSGYVSFEWLPETDATPENIHAKLCSIYETARAAGMPSRLLVYLTGMGDGFSRLCILDDKVITEQDLGGWLANLRAESVCPQMSLSVFLDICREAMVRHSPVDYDLALVWSCSVGQFSYGIPLGQDLPSSIFLIALFSASHDACVGPNSLEEAFILRMNHLGEYLRFLHRKEHEVSGRCSNCPDDGSCPPPTQEPEYEQTGFKALVDLGTLIMTGYPAYAREVSDALASKMEKSGFLKARHNNSPAPSGSRHELTSQGVQCAAQHPRGANKRGSQAAVM